MPEMLEVRNLKTYFPVRVGILDSLRGKKYFVKAVDGISFSIDRGEIFGLIGESGCGKTTAGRSVLRLVEPTGGEVIFDGVDVLKLGKEELRRIRRRMQIIFQDPYASLSPRMKIGEAIAHPLIIHGIADRREAREIALRMLKRVGLTPEEEYYDRYPNQLSGGQRQRVAIARAMALKPDFVVADEAVSMIDVSMRASILELLEEFRRDYRLSMLFITHDIAVARLIADRTAVMYLGKIVELGKTRRLIDNPIHPYTKALVNAAPSITRRERREKVKLRGEVPNAVNPPKGCRLSNRCPFATDICRAKEPELREVESGHFVACHLA